MPQKSSRMQRLSQAVKAVRNGMSFRQAAVKFGCCKSTLHIYVKRDRQEESEEVFSLLESEEERLGNWLVYCNYLGYTQISQKHLSREAQSLVKTRGVEQTFGREWCELFLQKQTYVQKSSGLFGRYSYMNRVYGYNWLESVMIYCKSQNLLHCFQDPRYMYYCCQLHVTDSLKIIIAYSAKGKITPPLIINVNLDNRIEFEEVALPQGWFKYNCQECSSFNDEDNPLEYYIEQILKVYLLQEDLNEPVLLFNKHINYPPALAFCELCIEHQIYPVNSLIDMFKLDKSLQMTISDSMKSVKDRSIRNFVNILNNILVTKLTKKKMCHSFSEAGIFPRVMDENVIKELPTLQMSSVGRGGESTQVVEKEFKIHLATNQTNSILNKKMETAKLIAESFKRKRSETSGETVFREDNEFAPLPKKQASSSSLYTNNYNEMTFRNFCLDDDDVAVCNEPIQSDDILCDTHGEIL